MVIVPAVLALIFVLLYGQFGDMTDAGSCCSMCRWRCWAG